jgi:hypothetical protein
VTTSTRDEDYLLYLQGRLMGLRVNRYSWWVHWRELADYFLPRRYKWLITPNMMGRGSPINQHILDSTGGIYAQRLAAGLISGKSSPTSPWFRLKVGRIDSTKTDPTSLWLAECERLLYLIFSESNFYNSMAVFYHDLVVFGTAVIIIYDDFKNVINCINPCAGEFYLDIDGKYRPRIFYREFTLTVDAVVNEFGLDRVSPSIRQLYTDRSGANRTKEVIVAHAIEPNDDGCARQWGYDPDAAFREAYWEWGGTTSPQGGVNQQPFFLRRKAYYEQRAIAGRWDTVSNDAYGRSPAMDALPDQKQIQLEQRRKAQAIDKMVNPPLVADIQLKNSPANLTPGGITYVQGFAAAGRPGFASVYETKFPVQEIVQDLVEVKSRISQTFFNDILRVASQYETRSNVTAVEWDLRKSESLVMLGPVLERLDNEVLKPIVETVFAIANRAGILPPAPAAVQGAQLTIDFQGMLLQAQQATQAASIERVLNLTGQLVGVKPDAMDNVDTDYAIEKIAALLNNDPKMIRSEDALAAIRAQRAQQEQQAQQAQIAQQLSAGAKNLATSPVSPDNALGQMMGAQQPA